MEMKEFGAEIPVCSLCGNQGHLPLENDCHLADVVVVVAVVVEERMELEVHVLMMGQNCFGPEKMA